MSAFLGSFFGMDFRTFFAAPVLSNWVASGVARKTRIWLSTRKNQWILRISDVLSAAGRAARQATDTIK